MPVHRDAITDVRGIRVGHWSDRRAATGCTVVLCPPGSIGGVDVRGAAPGTRETDLLRPGTFVEAVHAIVLGGGSAFGLEAATGVMRYLAERGIGFKIRDLSVPIVPAAIIFDLGIGRPHHPDADAGYRAASRATGGGVAQGTVGAGVGATIAKFAGRDRALKGGVGTASEVLDTGVIVAAIAVVNAVGTVRDPDTARVIAAPRADRAGFLDAVAIYRAGRPWIEQSSAPPPEGGAVADGAGEHTTLAVVATNAKLTKTQANRLATVAHDGFARAIWPVHTGGDGDVIFTVATGELELEAGGYGAIEAMATRAVERAIVNGVQHATGLAGIPAAHEWPAARQSRARR